MNNIGSFYEVQFEIESGCSLNCLHCSSQQLRKSPAREFNFDALLDFLRKLDSTFFLYLTGGEPILHKNICEKIYHAKQKVGNISIGMFTSGVGYNFEPVGLSFAKELKAAGLDECYVSLFHYIPELHDKITGFSGSFLISQQSIKNFVDAGIIVKAHTVITKFNYLDFETVIFKLLATELNSIRVLRIVSSGSAVQNWDTVGVSYEIQNKLVTELIDNISKYNSKVTISGFPDKIACRPFDDSQKCQAGIRLLYVTSDGEVYPCACTKNSKKFLIGSLADHGYTLKNCLDCGKLLYNETCLNSPLK